MKTITIVITEGPYGRLNANTALRVASAALKDGHKVNIFLTQDGVDIGNKKLKPKAHGGFLQLAEYLEEIVGNDNAKVKVCGFCAELRGFDEKDFPKKFEMSNAHELVEWILKSDKTITF